MAIAGFKDRVCLALRASGQWLRFATLQNLIASFPWIAPPRPPPWRNPRKGRDQICHLATLNLCSMRRELRDTTKVVYSLSGRSALIDTIPDEDEEEGQDEGRGRQRREQR